MGQLKCLNYFQSIQFDCIWDYHCIQFHPIERSKDLYASTACFATVQHFLPQIETNRLLLKICLILYISTMKNIVHYIQYTLRDVLARIQAMSLSFSKYPTLRSFPFLLCDPSVLKYNLSEDYPFEPNRFMIERVQITVTNWLLHKYWSWEIFSFSFQLCFFLL
jgi:hypothetical protein